MRVNKLYSITVQLLLSSLTLSTVLFICNRMVLSAFPLLVSVQTNDLEKPISRNAFIAKSTIPSITNRRELSSPLLLSISTSRYIGKWSNGRGETLSITPVQIQFDHNKKLAYKDITRVTDGNSFQIEITSRGKLNYFQRYMFLRIDGKQMTMTGYNLYEDMYSGQNQGSEVTWYR